MATSLVQAAADPAPPASKARVLLLISCALFFLWGLGARIDGWTLSDVATLGAALRGGSPPHNRPQILLLGDSLTERGENGDYSGWASRIRNHYARSADVIGRGAGGYNTKWYLQRVSPVIHQEIQTWLAPVLVTVWFGANDAALLTGHNYFQHVPIEDYHDNLHEIIRQLRRWAPRAELLLITPPPVDDDKRRTRSNGNESLDRSNEATGHYADMCKQVASEAGVEVLDLYSYFNNMTTWRRKGYFIDGLHFNSRGNKEAEQLIRDKIESSFPSLVSSLERWQVPDWEALIE